MKYLFHFGRYLSMLRQAFQRPEKQSIYFRQVLVEMEGLGLASVGIVAIISVFMGAVLAIQMAFNIDTPLIPSYTIGFVTRQSVELEFSPTIISLILAGKVGSRIASELGTMRVTEQIDAMEVSGTNPFKYLVVTRILATTAMLPILVFYSDFIAIFGSYLVENLKGDVSFLQYFNQVFDNIEFSDLLPATIKTFFFGFAIGMVGCFKGYQCKSGTRGVGIAANSAVVYSSMLLFVIDFIAVLITNIFIE